MRSEKMQIIRLILLVVIQCGNPLACMETTPSEHLTKYLELSSTLIAGNIMTTNTVMSLPSQWPKEVIEKYTPVRTLGRGGFGCVFMATEKNTKPDKYVAIKVVGSDGYAKREISILSELMNYAHPNIVKLVARYEPRPDECARTCLILSLARGPTLNYILEKGGALGLIMAKAISRQLIRAVAFLHGHAVIHRDIQPCNIIVSGSSMDDDMWWSDEFDVDGRVLGFVQRCHVTLIDFGFARALSPDDLTLDVGLDKVAKESELKILPSTKDAEWNGENRNICVNDSLHDASVHKKLSGARGRSRRRDSTELGSSQSHKRVRDLSALGTRNYAAPEIMASIRKMSSTMNLSAHSKSSMDYSRKPHTPHALSECVSSYGMVADAFSVGATLRYMATGVPPVYNVDEYIASKNHPVKVLMRALKRRGRKNAKRIMQYRSSNDLPNDAKHLISALTHYDSRKRATVRWATAHPWILNGVGYMQEETTKDLVTLDHNGPIVFLECSKRGSNEVDEDDSV